MFGFRTAFAAAMLVAGALAQTQVGFMSVPPVAVAGNTYNITWGGGDGTAVTLILKNGTIQQPDTVSIISERATGYSYMWTVDTALPTASNYLLQITQGVNDINFSGFFSIVGGTGTSSISYSGLATATSSSSSTENGTVITTGMTMTRGTAASMGTGTNMPRNTTFSSASLTGKTITTAASTVARATSPTSATSSTAPTSNVGASMGSSAAMVMGLFGAIMFLQ